MAVGLMDGFELLALSLLAPKIGKDLGIPIAGFTSIFVATSVGVIVGSALCGPMADRWGRRVTLIIAGFGMAVGMIGDGLSQNAMTLMLARVFTGMGVGAVLPAGTTLMAELAPPGRRNFFVSAVVVSTSLGAVLCALILPAMAKTVGWREIFVGAGCLSAVIAIAMMIWLSEPSADTRAGTPDDQDKPTVSMIQRAGDLFGGRQLMSTLLLWAIFFSFYIWLGFHKAWLPLIYGSTPERLATGAAATVALGLGSTSGAILSPIVGQRWGSVRPMMIGLAGGAIALCAMGMVGSDDRAVLTAGFFLAGICSSFVFHLIYGLPIALYPAAARSTGVSCATVCGRIGSLCGPLLGGLMVARHAGAPAILIAAATPVAIAFLLLLLFAARQRRAEA